MSISAQQQRKICVSKIRVGDIVHFRSGIDTMGRKTISSTGTDIIITKIIAYEPMRGFLLGTKETSNFWPKYAIKKR